MLYNTFTKVSVLYNYVILLVKRGNVIATNIGNKYSISIYIGITKGCEQQVSKGCTYSYVGSKYKADFSFSHFQHLSIHYRELMWEHGVLTPLE